MYNHVLLAVLSALAVLLSLHTGSVERSVGLEEEADARRARRWWSSVGRYLADASLAMGGASVYPAWIETRSVPAQSPEEFRPDAAEESRSRVP